MAELQHRSTKMMALVAVACAVGILLLCFTPRASAAPRLLLAPPSAGYLEATAPDYTPTVTESGRVLAAHVEPVLTQVGSGVRAAGDFPDSYDLRDHDKLTAVRDQGQYGTCWTFATMGALESFLMPSLVCNFSEDNLVNYSGYTTSNNYMDGGDYFMSLAYLLRRSGPKDDAADPYPTPEFTRGATTTRWVKDVWLIPPSDEAGWSDMIKTAVMGYGAVGTYMYWDEEVNCFDSTTNAYYFGGSAEANHAVDIVGWDDAFPRTAFLEGQQPEHDGAWLIRNSWGTEWGDAGYFWISYDDTVVGAGDNLVFTRVSPPSSRYRVYGHDKLGMTSAMGFAATSTSSVAWMASAYRARSARERLTGAGFYMVSNGKAVVYAGRTMKSLRRVATKTVTMPGYYTVGLAKKLALRKGQRFVVAVRIKTPACAFPIAVQAPTATADCTARRGMSWVSRDGKRWTDATKLAAGTAVCLKAVTRH